MKRARLTDELIVGVLQENKAAAKASKGARKHGASEVTISASNPKFDGLGVSEAQWLRTLEDETACSNICCPTPRSTMAALNQLLEKMVGPATMREGAAHLQAVFGMSQRLTCSMRLHLRSLAEVRRRFGYWRLLVMLGREGECSGKNRMYRLHCE